MEELRLQVFVDDPLAVARGTPTRRKRLFTMLVLGWRLLGIPLASHKSQIGTVITWIGIELQWKDNDVIATIPADKVAELTALTNEILANNVVSNQNP